MHCILRRCGILPSTPHSSGIVRLASGAFYKAISLATFYEIINNEVSVNSITDGFLKSLPSSALCSMRLKFFFASSPSPFSPGIFY
ncbi:MAG: hypothetical protein NTY64_03085 [Deltaproteobacteria bacterium]|nr:hypothetical protein [Deltaproteobacteria bacterium]